MMAALAKASLVSSNMLYQLGGIVQQNFTRQQAQQGYRTLKPKRDVTQVTCATAELLMEELIQFEIDLQELGVTVFAEAAFFQLRAVTQGQAKDVIEFALVREPMKRFMPQHWRYRAEKNGKEVIQDVAINALRLFVPSTNMQRESCARQSI